jgi:hypothetical protein
MLDLRAGSGVTLTKDPASGTLKIDVGVSANDLFIDPRKGPYNAAGNGTTDDAAALQSALNTGKLVYLDPSLTFAFGTRLLPPSGGGFIGGGTLLMLTGTGKFDASDYVSSSYDRTIGIYAEGLSNITINAKIQMQANAAIRTCNAIWIRNCTNVNLDVEISGFKEMRFGAIEWNSNKGGNVRAYVHDITTNSNTLPTMQLTALSVDSTRYNPGTGPINSTELRFDVRVKDITMGSTAITAYGYQTDGVNLQGDGWSGHMGRVLAVNVHEPLDCWSDNNIIEVVAQNCLFGVKLIYGASHNDVRATVDLFTNSALYLGGSTRSQDTAYNSVRLKAKRGGQIGAFANVAQVTIDGSGAKSVKYNEVDIRGDGDGVNLDYGVRIASGDNNRVTIEGTGFAVGTAIDGGVNNVIKRARPTLVRAHLSANQTYVDAATIICDTETLDRHGEYNNATGVFTCKCPGTYRVKFKSALSVNSGQGFGSYIRQNSTDISFKRETNTGAAGATLAHEHSALVQLALNDTVQVRNSGINTTTTFGGATGTYLEIEEI